MIAGPTFHWQLAEMIELLSHRHAAGGDEADMILVGIDDVLHRAIEPVERDAKGGGVDCVIHQPEGLW
jgi:hypothetical protein